MGQKILFICPYPENTAPSQRLKYEQYFEHFRAAGFLITVSSFINLPFWNIIYKKGFFLKKTGYTISAYLRRYFLLFSIRKFDIVYVHLWATPFGPPFYEWLLCRIAKKIIYDIDDLIYLKNVKSGASVLIPYIKGRTKPLFLIKNADHVITCTPYLDKYVRKYNQHTTDISSTVDTEKRYLPLNNYSNDKPVTLGWSGSLSTSKYFYLLENVLRKLYGKYNFNILVIGDKNVKVDGMNIEAIDWNEETEISNLRRIDIGLYPLPEEEWVLGKSGLKAIQYMALGIPTVAKAIGSNFRVIENDVSGFLVNTDEEWIDALSRLIEDAGLRKRIGTEARKRAEDLFSTTANSKKYLDILNSLCHLN